MILQQKKFPFIRCRFELTETALLVAVSHFPRTSSGEVPLRELRPTPSYLKQFALSSLMFAISLTALTCTLAVSLFDAELAAYRMAAATGVAILGFLAICLWLRFFSRNVDYVIFHARNGGRPLVYIHRMIPTPRHVEEFVEILREKIEQTGPA